MTTIPLRDARAKCVKITQQITTTLRNQPKNRAGTRIAKLLSMRIIACLILLAAPVALAQNVGDRVWTPPPTGNFFPLSDTNFPPIPTCPDLPIYYLGVLPGMNGPCYGYDDSTLSGGRTTADVDPPPIPGDGQGDGGPDVPSSNTYPSYGPNDLYLTIDRDTNQIGFVDMVLHGATNGYWELLNKDDLNDTGPWAFREIQHDDGTTNELFYTPLPDDNPPIRFFRAVGGDTVVSIKVDREFSTPKEPCSPGDTGEVGKFDVNISPTVPRDLTIIYSISGSAINGVDYTSLSGSVVIPANTSFAEIVIQPLYDTLLEFDESVTLTLVLTNGYVVDPLNATVTEWISDCSSNVFSFVATNVPSPIGIDYFSPSNTLVLSWEFDANGETNNFVLLDTNQVFTRWSGVHGVLDEVKIATVKRTIGGFTNADMYFGSGTGIGWVSADGTRSNLTFAVLTNAVVTNAALLRGSLYVDRTGTWSNQLIAVTGDSVELTDDPQGVWRVDSQGHPTLVKLLSAGHLEGVVTLTNDVAKWGPWAGKIITGDENLGEVYAIDTNGVSKTYHLGIDCEDFDIIEPNQDLYCVLYNGSDSSIVKVSRSIFTNYVGSLIITDSGEVNPDQRGYLYIVTWTGTQFDVRRIALPTIFGVIHFEHVTFAPINLPDL